MSYTDVFGGSTVQPGDVQFRAVALSASITTVWPAFATSDNQIARIMKVSPSAGSLSVTLPVATLGSVGQDVLFDNAGAETFMVLDSTGASIATLTAGQVKYLYLSDNSTAAGTWRVTLFGASASTLDASQLSGYGLKALSGNINIAAPVSAISSNTTVYEADRAKVFVWTGGSGTLTLPSTAGSTSDFAIEVRNQGTGTLTVGTTGGSLVDGSATITLVVNESCFIHMGAADWYTVGRGRNTQFNFTQLAKTVTGGSTSLSLTEASNVVQNYIGTLTSNQIIVLPAVVQVYYVSNATTGAYTLTFSCVAGGTSVAVSSRQAAILFCDGTNIINANTQLSGGISALLFGNGSVTGPSAAFGTSTNGFYVTGTNEIGVAINGVYAGKWSSAGFTATNLSGTNTGDNSANTTYAADYRAANFVAGTNYQAPIGTISGLAKGNGANALTVATAGTDYLAPPSGSAMLKANAGGALANAAAGTDYLAPALANTAVTGFKTATFNSQTTIATTTGAITVDWTSAQNQKQTEPTGTITYTFTAPPGPCHLQLLVDSDGVSTAQTVVWPGTVVWLGATWAGTANKKAIINFWYDGTSYFAIGTNQA